MPDIHSLLMQNIGTILTGLASLAAVLALVWLKKHFVTWKAYDARQERIDRRFSDHDTRLDKQGNRVAAIESGMCKVADALDQLPRREDILNLELGLSEVRGGLREVSANIQGLRDLVERQEGQTLLLQEHVLDLSK